MGSLLNEANIISAIETLNRDRKLTVWQVAQFHNVCYKRHQAARTSDHHAWLPN